MQSLIDMVDNAIGKSDCDDNEARILSLSSASKKPTGVGNLTSGTIGMTKPLGAPNTYF